MPSSPITSYDAPMNDRSAIWFPIGLMLLLAALTYWLARVVEHPQPAGDGNARHDPDYIVDGLSAVQLGLNGAPKYTLAAAKMIHYPDDDSTRLFQPDLTEFRQGRAPVRIQAEQGQVSSNGKVVILIGDVRVARRAQGDQGPLTLTTDWLRILPDDGLANTDRAVTISNANAVVHAVGLELNNNTGILKLLSRVRGRYEKVD